MPESPPQGTTQRDVFLSHAHEDGALARRLAADIEQTPLVDRHMTAWLDEAEIKPGMSVTSTINSGLEASRHVVLIMTPAYFSSRSGWTDAEWHAALHLDPDNRLGRIISILAADCPYIPVLLRHLMRIDIRGVHYDRGLLELREALLGQSLTRPATVRGQLIRTDGRIDRSTLVAERAMTCAYPDAVQERLYSNLLPVERPPLWVYVAPVSDAICARRADGTLGLPSKQAVKVAVRRSLEERGKAPFVPAFRLHEGHVVTFHDLEAPDGAFSGVVEADKSEPVLTQEYVRDEDDRRLVTSLLNMAVSRHAYRVGLVADQTKQGRFFFPPDDGRERVIYWTPFRKRASRTVAKPCCTKEGQVLFWRHQGAYLSMSFLSNRYYLRIKPTWVITSDGAEVMGGQKVSNWVINWTGPERNLQVLYHIRFWTTILHESPGPISVRAGDQRMELRTTPAFVEQNFGIAHDRILIKEALDEEAELIANREEELADAATETAVLNSDAIEEEPGLSVSEDESTDEEAASEEDARE